MARRAGYFISVCGRPAKSYYLGEVMAQRGKNNRLDYLMEEMGIRANALAAASGADHSLITKWRRGERSLTRRSEFLPAVAKALLQLDENHLLENLLAPYRQKGESAEEALCIFLTSADQPGLVPRTAPEPRRVSGEYTVEHRVFLGEQGFRKATLAMLDYLSLLPPEREIMAVCHGSYSWVVKNLSYTMMLIGRLQSAFSRGTTLTMINRKGYTMADTAAFAAPWLVAHMRGLIRSRYYEGDMPEGERIIASIADYWSLRARQDPEVEDELFVAMYTDPLDIRQDMQTCQAYYARSKPVSQYGFLRQPQGSEENPKLWHDDALPLWTEGPAPDGSFHAIQRVPGFGIFTQEEFAAISGGDAPALPSFLFARKPAFGDIPGGFAPGPHRIILCREDVRAGLAGHRRQHEVMSEVLHRRAFVPSGMLAAQLRRLLAAMAAREDFEVALVPRVAFARLQLEMTCWQNSATVGMLQDQSNSVLTDDKATSGSLHAAVDYIWGKLLSGWTRRSTVRSQLNKWLAGKELGTGESDSAIVRGWHYLPKE